MQTFLPFPDFRASAEVLDRQRLGKQRVECLQILQALSGQKQGWVNHPAVRMWAGYESALAIYGVTVCNVWADRGYDDSCKAKICALELQYFSRNYSGYPPWFGDPAFHFAHQSNLIRKDPAYYGPLFPGVPDNLPYVWPKG